MTMEINHTLTEADIVSRCRAVTKPGLHMLLPQTNRVESVLPNFKNTIAQVLAIPSVGAEFIQYELHLEPGGGTVIPLEDEYEHFFFVLEGGIRVAFLGEKHDLTQGGFAYLPSKSTFHLENHHHTRNRVLWTRCRYKSIGSLPPDPIFGNEKDVPGNPHQYLIPFENNLAYDMAFNIVNLDPGMHLKMVESHVMQHGLYMLQGRGIYLLAGDYHEVQANDYIFMASYCTQFFFVTGNERGRYLLYKKVNRDYNDSL